MGHQAAIFQHLRKQIISGKLRPGQRLPAQWELVKKFDASALTAARAYQRLIEMGFARSESRRGTFVVDRPPHLTRYVLVFQSAPDSETALAWSRFDTAICDAARVIGERRGISFPVYYNVDGHPDSEGYRALMSDIENHRLAGILFTFAPHLLQATSLMERSDPPRVNTHPVQGSGIGVTRVLDERRFFYRAIEMLEADGRKRFSVITKPEGNPGFPDEFEAAVESRGAMLRPFWTQAVEPHHPRWVRHAVRAILGDDPSCLPDAMLVTDDHLVEPVADALFEFGVRVPQDIRVVGHWNFPLPYRGRVPVDLLGYDICELLDVWVDAIDAQRHGEPQAAYATMPPRFSWEIQNNNDPSRPSGDPVGKRSTSIKGTTSF